MAARFVRRRCGIWLDDHTVSCCGPRSQRATTPRVSIGLGTRRWLTMRRLTVRWALRKAASVASLSPTSLRKASLPGALSHTTPAPGCRACSTSTTAGSSS